MGAPRLSRVPCVNAGPQPTGALVGEQRPGHTPRPLGEQACHQLLRSAVDMSAAPMRQRGRGPTISVWGEDRGTRRRGRRRGGTKLTLFLQVEGLEGWGEK